MLPKSSVDPNTVFFPVDHVAKILTIFGIKGARTFLINDPDQKHVDLVSLRNSLMRLSNSLYYGADIPEKDPDAELRYIQRKHEILVLIDNFKYAHFKAAQVVFQTHAKLMESGLYNPSLATCYNLLSNMMNTYQLYQNHKSSITDYISVNILSKLLEEQVRFAFALGRVWPEIALNYLGYKKNPTTNPEQTESQE